MSEQIAFDLDPNKPVRSPSRQYSPLGVVSIALSGNIEDMRQLAASPIACLRYSTATWLVVTGLLTILVALASGPGGMSTVQDAETILLQWLITAIVHLVIALMIHWWARFSSHGNFGKFFFIFTAYSIPLLIVAAISGLVPPVGPTMNLLAGLFGMLLGMQAVQAVYQITGGKALVMVIVATVSVRLLATSLLEFLLR